MGLVRTLAILQAVFTGCIATEAGVVLTDPATAAQIASSKTSEDFPPTPHRAVSDARAVVLDGLGVFTFDGTACVLAVDRPRFGPFRFSSPRCVVHLEAERICIEDVVLRDELAASDELPTTLRLGGCARRSPQLDVIDEHQPPPEPREVCVPVLTLEEHRKIAAVVVVSSLKVLEPKTNSDGTWIICYYGLPTDAFHYELDVTLEDGSTASVTWGGRTVID